MVPARPICPIVKVVQGLCRSLVFVPDGCSSCLCIFEWYIRKLVLEGRCDYIAYRCLNHVMIIVRLIVYLRGIQSDRKTTIDTLYMES